MAESGGTPHARRAVYVISVAAELAGVHPQTLRIYERKGLLDPARTASRTSPA
jgi:MerR family transcriptional regulator/heat shock protein HspR